MGLKNAKNMRNAPIWALHVFHISRNRGGVLGLEATGRDWGDR